MKIFVAIIVALGVLVAPAIADASVVPSQTAPRYTLMMGRAINAQYADGKCKVPTTSIPLATTASTLAAAGLRATVPATLDQVSEDPATPVCSGRLSYATWPELRALRDTYGWDVVPRGATSDVITGLSGQALYDNTCGLLPTFADHGFPDAWGLYAYPQNRFTTENQQTVKTCYGYGRQYAGLGKYNKMEGFTASAMVKDPWFQKTISVNGGLCNDSSQPCYSDKLVRNARRYMLPAQLDASVSTLNGTWSVVQFYRLVDGSQGTAATAAGLPAWDCTSPDPARHWSHLPEEYCWADFEAYISGLPAGIVDADPAEVATLYGRAVTP